jgi:uncharacterized 2Fe-2S/4Fe-4S cluster protein (DUF4445 family)
MSTFKVEIDPSGRAKCTECDALIRKGDIRLVDTDRDYMGHPSSKKYCLKCGAQHLAEVINTAQHWLLELQKGV